MPRNVERWLVTGASGQLGGYLLRALAKQDCFVTAWSGTRQLQFFGIPCVPVDLRQLDRVGAAFRALRPAVVLHLGALAAVGNCARDPERARRVNVHGSTILAELAAKTGARLIYVSTDLVFDGAKGNYREDDAANPLSIYGKSKRDAEQAVLAAPRSAVLRLSLLFGPTLVSRPSFFDAQLAALREGKPVPLFADEWRTPLSLPMAAEVLIAVAESTFTGLLHVGGPERMSRLEMGQRLAVFLGLNASALIASRREDVPAPEPRPRDVSLDSARWRGLFPAIQRPNFEDALREMLG